MDVFGSDEWPCDFIIDSKYRSGNEGRLCTEMRDWHQSRKVKEWPPALLVVCGDNRYHAVRLKDFTSDILLNWYPDGSVDLNTEEFDETVVEMRAGTKYIDEWFEKLVGVYREEKAEEFGEEETNIVPLVVIRRRGVRETIVLLKANL